jgi:AraC-like DNA-binding protein
MEKMIKPGPPLLRFAHPLAFATYLRGHGARADFYLRKSGLPTLCEDPTGFAPLQRIWTFFDSASRSETPALGWLVGAKVGDSKLNSSLLRKLESAPTLLQALQRFERLYKSEVTDSEIGIKEHRHGICLYTRYKGLRDEPGYHVSQAYQLGVFVDLIRHFLGEHWVPHEIGIESKLIPPGAAECYPGSRILTEQPAGYVVVPRWRLHQSSAIRDQRISKAKKALLKDYRFSEIPTDCESRLRLMLRSYLSEGYISQKRAAELMNTSVRSLSRRLAARGCTYRTLIDDLRFETAKEQLMKSDKRIGDIALSVGFNHQADFTRMFKRVGGLSPKQYRESIHQ